MSHTLSFLCPKCGNAVAWVAPKGASENTVITAVCNGVNHNVEYEGLVIKT